MVVRYKIRRVKMNTNLIEIDALMINLFNASKKRICDSIERTPTSVDATVMLPLIDILEHIIDVKAEIERILLKEGRTNESSQNPNN